MSSEPKKIATISRMNKGLGLLQAGSMVTIDIVTPAGQKGKFRTCFVGYLPKKYVLLQYPDSGKLGNFSQFIKKETSITVRGLIEGHEGSVAAFVSQIKRTILQPSKLIVLEFPKTVTLQSLRNCLRIDTDIKAKLKVGKEYWQSMITDLSVNGCQLTVNNGESITLSKNRQVEVIIEDFQGLKNLKLQADICSVKPLFNGISLGLKFIPTAKSSVVKLLHHIVTIET